MSRWKIVGIIALLVVLAGAGWIWLKAERNDESIPAALGIASSEPPLGIKHLGIELAPYNEATGKAGDLVFHKDNLEYNLIYMPYGWQIPANSAGAAKGNPQPTFVAPIGTPVRSIVDGIVVDIPTLYSGDVAVHVAKENGSSWIYETEHVMNPTIQVGDRVTAGQVIAEVSDYTAHSMPGYGYFEIGILKGGNPPSHVCPFAYLDESAKATIEAQLRQLYTDWETYMGDTTLYNDAESPIGCTTTDVIAE